MTRGSGTGTTRSELWDAWIAGYEAALGVGFWNERFDGSRAAIAEKFDLWLRHEKTATEPTS